MTIFDIGPTLWMKGASAAEEQLQQQQSAFYSTLTDLFQQQFAQSKSTLDFLQTSLEPLIQNPQGYDAATLNSMRTSASDTIATQYQNAAKTMQNRSFVLGGRQVPSGVQQAQQEGLTASQAATESNAQNQITQANANLKQTNFWNAISALSGVGGMQSSSASSLMGGANNAFNGAFNAAHTINQENSSWGSIFGGLAGGVLKGLGSASSFLNTSGNPILNGIGGVL